MSDEEEQDSREQRPSRGPIYLALAFLAIFIMVTLGVIFATQVDTTPGGTRAPFQWEHLKDLERKEK